MTLTTRYCLSAAGLLGALFLAQVSAAKLKETVDVDMPGVDVDGLFDDFNTGEGTAKVVLNTKNGKFKFRAKGNAPNESGQSQTFKNDPEVEDFFAFQLPVFPDITRSKYRVSAGGKAKGAAKGTAQEL